MRIRDITAAAGSLAMLAAMVGTVPAQAASKCYKPSAATASRTDPSKMGEAVGCPDGMMPRHHTRHSYHGTGANPNGTGVANGRTGGQPLPDEPLPAQPQAEPTPSQ